MTARGEVLALALDAIDPRLSETVRGDAVATAFLADPMLAATTWAGMLFGLVHALHGQYGDDGLAEIMGTLTTIAVGVVNAEGS